MQLIYAWQWVAFHLGIVMTAPVVLGSALMLEPMEIAALTQRVFLLVGTASLLQVLFGHRQILVEGPAAPWWAAYVILAELTVRIGGDINVLRTDIQGAMIVVGIVLMLGGAFGLVRRMLPYFTPPVTGTLLILFSLQIGGIGVKSILNAAMAEGFNPRMIVIAVAALTVIIMMSIRAKGVWKSIAVITGIVTGWLMYYLWGFSTPVVGDVPFIMMPQVFPWGIPTFNPGVIASLVLLGLVMIPNVVASINAMENAIQQKIKGANYDRGLFTSGVSDTLAGVTGAIGSIPFAISAGLVAISGIKDRLPFILGCVIFILMGIFPAIGKIVASIPAPVVGAVLMVSASPLAAYGLKDYARCTLDNRDTFVIGLSLMIGVGVMLIPGESWRQVPLWTANIFSNGVITGTAVCFLMEHVVLPNPEKVKKSFGSSA